MPAVRYAFALTCLFIATRVHAQPTYAVLDLGDLGNPDDQSAVARGINDSGVVVGDSTYPNGGGLGHGFCWTRGTVTDLGTLPGGTSSTAFAINSLGQIAGRSTDAIGRISPVLWEPNGAIVHLGSLGVVTVQSHTE